MPEIPELEAIRAFCNEHLAGHGIASAETRIPVVFRTPAAQLAEALPADTFGEVLRHGKFLLFPLASGRVLAINAMLTGRFQYVAPERKLAAKTCLVVEIDTGKQLRYADQRLMGRIYLVAKEELGSIPGWNEGGPDLLDPELDEETWLRRIKSLRGRIKGVLTKAEFVQGIGNAYSDEILWEAQINPHAPRTELEEEQLRELYRAARRVMEWAIPQAAERMIRDGELDYTERRDFLRVHRRGGQACPRCGHRISELTSGQRITSFCRNCQPGFVRP